MTSMLAEGTKRFLVTAIVHAQDGAIVPVESARAAVDSWYRAYLDTWTRSDGMAGVGSGGLVIETWGLVWFVTPFSQALDSALYWLYALSEVLRGAAAATIGGWEESRMQAVLRGSELWLEETDPASGFVFFPLRKLDAEVFFEQILRECRRIQDFGGELLAMCDREAAPKEFRRSLSRNASDGFSEAIDRFERDVVQWRALRGRPGNSGA